MSHQKIFDQTLKLIARRCVDTLIALAFPGLDLRPIGAEENVELTLPSRAVDFVHRVAYGEQELLLHYEFQTRHHAGVPRRVHYYNAALTEQYHLPVITVVFYIYPRQAPIPDAHEVRLGRRVLNSFRYQVVKLWEHTDAIRDGTYRALAPLLPALVPQPDETLLEEERNLIRQEADEELRALLMALALTVAERYFDREKLWTIFRKEVEAMEELTLIEEWILEKANQRAIPIAREMAEQMAEPIAREMAEQMAEPIARKMAKQIAEPIARKMAEQIAEQRAKALALETLRNSLLDIVAARFSPALTTYRRIEKALRTVTDLDHIQHLLQVAAQAENIEAVEQAVQEATHE